MFDSGLLVLTSNALRLATVPRLLRKCSEVVRKKLLVHLINSPECLKSSSTCPVPYSRKILNVINEFYRQSANECRFKDLTFVVFNITNGQSNLTSCSPSICYDVVLTNIKEEFHEAIQKYLQMYFLSHPIDVLKVDTIDEGEVILTSDDVDFLLPQFDSVCLGGTFDNLHNGHKILLTQGALMAKKKLIVGATEGEMNKKKVLYELMEPTEERIDKVKRFLQGIKQNLEYQVVPIGDPFGPSIEDASIQAIAVSEETKEGADSINKRREQNGFNKLHTEVVQLVYSESEDNGEKISSTNARKQLLGTLLRRPQSKSLPRRPYLIGLTGCIASGKTSIGKKLEKLGAGVINCDLLGHKAYEPNSEAFKKVVMAFGEQVILENGNIDRRLLGRIVFNDKAKLSLLNSIVWPRIIELVREEVDLFARKGFDVVVLDAAVLLEAGWDDCVHEVWTAIIPADEAELRIMERNKISSEEARQRIHSQMCNEDRVKRSNVILCTLWEYEVTQRQIEKAWNLLQERMTQS